MIVFISGGCKNGKSTLAEDLAVKLAGDGPRYYVATMVPHDEEDRARIEKHRSSRRGKGFETLECAEDVSACAKGRSGGTFLLDSVTALVSNMMFKEDGTVDEKCSVKASSELLGLARGSANSVFVSDFIYADAEGYGDLTESYRRQLALTDRALAGAADLVIEVCCGMNIIHKGGMPL
ncbi:MAG: bifunctional adenosylcobinamide kinase/adenosylcobinamide-phosphate guanylyltransferase [Firmicutes bacterium]|nr:bifunctional adenosylcobinamide kinase/adenosylcobinamide-phosphate guanylyltransferase [Bacillota bacterium]MBQ6259788.1 bifunctional adenosylcobinamide kinase/adenosylcobinamide-phosphate guanylyltransferase [Bacillota bacterium]MBR0115405.1 bifunctional adenosylcobinamide kinase/adenosylcobinamide-phosphate guanylyltransferase [Bacillota bacterium]